MMMIDENAFAELVIWRVPSPLPGSAHDLIDAGLLRKTREGKILFPYDAVHVDFLLSVV